MVVDSMRIVERLERIAPGPSLYRRWLGVFDGLLAEEGRYLMGNAFTAADVCTFPFLKYTMVRDPDDDERFHRILEEHLAPGKARDVPLVSP